MFHFQGKLQSHQVQEREKSGNIKMLFIVLLSLIVAVDCQNISTNVSNDRFSTVRSLPDNTSTIFNPDSTGTEPSFPSLSGKNCSLVVNKDSEDLKQALILGNHMLIVTFSFKNENRETPISMETPQPLTWVHVSGNHGKGLLWLRQDFEMLSLTSLRYGVARLDVQLTDSPEGCLGQRSASQIGEDIQTLILNNLNTDPITNTSWIGSDICNARFRFNETPTNTQVYFVCCQKDAVFETSCYELERTTWMNIFLLSILVLPFIALMFAPLLIPYDLFRDDSTDIFYQHRVGTPLQIHVTKLSDRCRVTKGSLEIPKIYFNDMPRFCSTLATLNDNLTYDCTLEKIHFYVERDNLIGKDTDPFGPFTMLFNMFSQYEQRRRSFNEGNSFREYFSILKGKLLNTAHLLVIITFVNIPFVIRIIFFVVQTIPDWYITNSLKKLELNANVLQYSSFGVTFIPRIQIYLTYLILIALFVLVQFFKIRGTHQVDIVLEILKQCLRDSRKRHTKQAFQTIYKACRSVVQQSNMLGRILALFYFVLFLPFVVFNFIFYLLPTINLTLSMPIYLFTYVLSNKCGCLSRSSCVRAIAKHVSDGLGLDPIFIQNTDAVDSDNNDDETDKLCSPADTFIILILVCSIPVLIFVSLDSISFYVDIFIYVLIGLLLNASFTTTYVILSLMLTFYIKDLFDGVTNRYIKFINIIISEAMKKTRTDVIKVSLLNENLQKNTAFRLTGEAPLGKPEILQETSNDLKLSHEADVLLWRTRQLMFFLDKKDTPFIPRKFFTETSVMDCSGIPGPLGESLRAVLITILKIFVFLFLILLVALAFSEETETPGTNQTLTVIASGMVPWLLRKVLQAPTEQNVDVDNLHFREVFNDVIRHYEETWTVADIEIARVQVSENQIINDIDSHDDLDKPREETFKPSSSSHESSSETVETMASGSRNPTENSGEIVSKIKRKSDSQNHLVILVDKKSSRAHVV
ncbi:uncharacterized protein LOC132548084 [Ylistrum balloti]|uniref:uncharacterized protein LOC132548084 n=1 Tax=Ylistrum balloti TaxID=509963 RepID=UPI002905808A|nr:uncharacterized protein LOC132548084 [Ylistrum balloti]